MSLCCVAGLPPGSKPPPLTMLSPVGNKVGRNTATVPPLNQTSPSGGNGGQNQAMSATRASSFAAALRKLAKQAGDPPGKYMLYIQLKKRVVSSHPTKSSKAVATHSSIKVSRAKTLEPGSKTEENKRNIKIVIQRKFNR